MQRTVLDFSKHTEREILMNVVPRLENVEDKIEQQGKEIERQSKRQDNLESAINALRRDLIDTEARLSRKVDERFDKIDEHLSQQDARLDRLVDSKRNWPQGAIIAVSTVGTLLVGIGVAAVTHILKF